MAWICLVLGEKTLKANLELAGQHQGYFDLLELRADRLNPDQWDHLNDFPLAVQVPCILTLRKPGDGGSFEGSSRLRAALFTKALESSFKYWDLEDDDPLPDLESRYKQKGGRIIRSFHDFEGVPRDLAARIKAASASGAIPKAAVYPQNSQDLLFFWQTVLSLDVKEKIVLAMGPFGLSSRVLTEKTGSLWTYASPQGQSLAPGQIDPIVLENLYRFRAIKKNTAVYGIVGNPVYHSKSPILHNPALKEVGIQGVYAPFLCDDWPSFMDLADLLGIQGLSVTIPFKETARKFLGNQVSPAAQAIGAVNTLIKGAEGWYGENTDAPGFMTPLIELYGTGLKGLKVTVLGTGGSARGIIYALKTAGAQVCLLGRNRTKVEALAREFDVLSGALEPGSRSLLEQHASLIVQTTSVGMGDQEGQNPLEWYKFSGKETVYDIIYIPRHTALIQAAEKAGSRIIFGSQMLLEQGYIQFSHFTGQPYPESLKPRVERLLTETL